MKYLHFIGIGGIGMSGLAAWCRSLNIRVSGSDRDAGKKENSHIFGPLRNQGIELFPQDGSFAKAGLPDALLLFALRARFQPVTPALLGCRKGYSSVLRLYAILYAVMHPDVKEIFENRKKTDRSFARM